MSCNIPSMCKQHVKYPNQMHTLLIIDSVTDMLSMKKTKTTKKLSIAKQNKTILYKLTSRTMNFVSHLKSNIVMN